MIWVIAGTKDAREIIKLLLKKKYTITATTTTDYGKSLIETDPNLKIISKSLDKKDMNDFIKKNSIKIIIDASHPFATEVSKNAIYASNDNKINYIRYERKKTDYSNALKFKNFNEAAEYLSKKNGNILLTIGVKNLKYFKNIDKKRIFIRILPIQESILSCKKLGFLPEQMIYAKGPFSYKFNKSIMEKFNIEYLVTKDSGIEGGILEKINAAEKLNVETIMIDREKIDYPEVFYRKKDILKRIMKIS